jgi:hypothetical protein
MQERSLAVAGRNNNQRPRPQPDELTPGCAPGFWSAAACRRFQNNVGRTQRQNGAKPPHSRAAFRLIKLLGLCANLYGDCARFALRADLSAK